MSEGQQWWVSSPAIAAPVRQLQPHFPTQYLNVFSCALVLLMFSAHSWISWNRREKDLEWILFAWLTVCSLILPACALQGMYFFSDSVCPLCLHDVWVKLLLNFHFQAHFFAGESRFCWH